MKKTIKAYVAGFLTCIFIVATAASSMAWANAVNSAMREISYGVRVVVDGMEMEFDNDMHPFIMDGRAFLPVRGIADAFGVNVEWEGSTSTVYIGDRPVQVAQTQPQVGSGTTKTHLTIAMAALPWRLDPSVANDASSQLGVKQIFDTLVILDYDTMEVMPSLAIAWDMPDAQTMNMELRRDVYFHNGMPLTARDVQFSLERAGASVQAAPILGMIDTVTVYDEFNFTIHLEIPFAPILRHLAHPMGGIVPRSHVLRVGDSIFEENPIGTGPFMLDGLEHGWRMDFVRNDNYWGELPQIETMTMWSMPDPALRSIAIETGEADIALGVQPADTAHIRSVDHITLLQEPSLGIDYIGFNMQIEPWNNPLVMQAMNYALNTQEMIDIAFYGIGSPATSLVPNTAWGYSEVEPFTTNIERARDLLRLAGYENGFGRPVEIWFNIPNLQRENVSELVQLTLAQLNIDVHMVAMEWGTYLHELDDFAGHDMFVLGWVATTGDADYALFPLLHSTNFGGAGNRTWTSNPDIDRLLEEGRSELDPARRAAIYAEILQIQREHPSKVIIRQHEHLAATSNNVRGFTLSPTGIHSFANVYFAD
ncbi:MAG: ABC transporter substrate-binding protein [Defluviitaleaceae bacterium]|nr:ABC transporter substrate-binding protein [Defluviitaleaceae bacterium]